LANTYRPPTSPTSPTDDPGRSYTRCIDQQPSSFCGFIDWPRSNIDTTYFIPVLDPCMGCISSLSCRSSSGLQRAALQYPQQGSPRSGSSNSLLLARKSRDQLPLTKTISTSTINQHYWHRTSSANIGTITGALGDWTLAPENVYVFASPHAKRGSASPQEWIR